MANFNDIKPVKSVKKHKTKSKKLNNKSLKNFCDEHKENFDPLADLRHASIQKKSNFLL